MQKINPLHQHRQDGGIVRHGPAVGVEFDEASLRAVFQPLVNLPLSTREDQGLNIHSLRWKVDDELSILVTHVLLSTEETGFKDKLNDVDCFRILVEERDRDKAAEEAVDAPWIKTEKVSVRVSRP